MNIFDRPHTIIFAIALFFYIAITAGNFWEADSQAVFYLTKNIVDKGQLTVPCYPEAALYQDNCYAKYGIFSSLVVIPFYLLEKLFSDVLHNNYFFQGFFSSLTNPFITALLLTLFYKYLIKLKFSKKLAIFGVFLYGFFTYLPAYTKTLFSEPLLTLLIYLVLYILLFRKNSNQNLFIAGLFFGLAFLTKLAVVVIVPVILYLFYVRKCTLRQILFFSIPVILCTGIFFEYNFTRFGNIFDTGYRNIQFNHPFFYGLYLHILSPGKSLFLYQPFLIFSLFGLKIFFQKSKEICTAFFLLFIAHLIFYSVYMHPIGDLAWGSRYMYPTIGFFAIGVIYFIRYNKNKFLKYSFRGALIISALIQFSAVYLSYHRYFSYSFVQLGNRYLETVYNKIDKSPLYGQWKLIFRLDYKQVDKPALREAFQEYVDPFNLSYKIASPDLFFLRSRSQLPYLFLLVILESCLAIRLIIKARLSSTKK